MTSLTACIEGVLQHLPGKVKGQLKNIIHFKLITIISEKILVN